jgi:hypothetical protein
LTTPYQVIRWISSMAAIAVGLAWLHLLGAGDLAAPPMSVGGAASWLEHHDTAVAVFVLLRLAAIGMGWYLLIVSGIGGAARALQLRRATSAIDRLTLPFARGILSGMAVFGVGAAPPPVLPRSPDSMVELSPDLTSTVPATDTSAVDDSATLRLLPDTSVPAPPSSVPAYAVPAQVPLPPPDTDDPGATDSAWVVQHGDSFWSIASEHLADVSGRSVTEGEVGSYWRQLVERNRSRLVNPNDADLLFTGQVIELPAVTSG